MRNIVVTFDLASATTAQYTAAYQTLAGLGLTVVQQGILLPTTTLIGIWWSDSTAEEIRVALLGVLFEARVQPEALAVAVFTEAAWWRRPG